MTHNFPVPDETRLEHLINRMFVKLPVPEIIRLNRIEERLSRQLAINRPKHPVNKIPWWIVLLLAGGFATAAWWLGESYTGVIKTDNYSGSNVDDPAGRQTNIIPDAGSHQDKDQNQHKDSDHKQSPIIYQREY